MTFVSPSVARVGRMRIESPSSSSTTDISIRYCEATSSDLIARLPTVLTSHTFSYLSLTHLYTFCACSRIHRRHVVAYVTIAEHLHLVGESKLDVLEPASRGACALLCSRARQLRHITIRNRWPSENSAVSAFECLVRHNCATLRTIEYPNALGSERVWEALATCSLLESFDARSYASGNSGPQHNALHVVRECRNLRALTLDRLEDGVDDEDVYDENLTAALSGLDLRSLDVKRFPIASVRVLTSTSASLTFLSIGLVGDDHYKLACIALERELPALSGLQSLRVEAINVTGSCDETCVWRSASLTCLNYDVTDDTDLDAVPGRWPHIIMPLLVALLARATLPIFTNALGHSPLLRCIELEKHWADVASHEADAALCGAILAGGGSKLEMVDIQYIGVSKNVVMAMTST
jgi:hypothetical protein